MKHRLIFYVPYWNKNPSLCQDCDPDPLLCRIMPLQSSVFDRLLSRSRQKISKKFFPTRFASCPDRRLWQKKKARQLAFSPYPQQKRSIKKQNKEAMFRNETRSSGHSFFARSARIIISPGMLHRQTIPLRDDCLRQQRGGIEPSPTEH